ncbi:hypothetical protein K2173_004759 [Erythroxylum novogranatense]|uniref:NAB domain-containing protein n=1 Tax=Erythroxylum novogranatense TaxID=1862640 RepID=A0AAV8SJM6_9ROSI|nr:hypothetical protein K2173_004759 [Erythroxylum novogranatense]
MDIEERVVMLLKSTSEEEEQLQSNSDTFAERAEFYFHKRPQLLVLLRDLYGSYITLLERCKRNESKKSLFSSDIDLGVDEMVAELVWKNVERELLVDQVGEMEQQGCVSSKMIDLLKKLLEILESERVVLLNENARLEQMVSALLEENRGLKSEGVLLKKKANELARYVVKVTEDHRMALVSRKTEHLEEQIYGLKERRKIEYYSDEQLVTFRRETRKGEMNRNLNGYCYQNAGWFQFEKLKIMKRGENGARSYSGEGVRSGGSEKQTSSSVQKWWGRMRTTSVDFLMRGGGLRRYSST